MLKMCVIQLFYYIYFQSLLWIEFVVAKFSGNYIYLYTFASSVGIFITNVAARNQSMRDMVYSAVQQVFPTVAYIPLDEDVNEILLALPHSQIALSQLSAATHNVQLTAEEQARKPENSICGGESLFQKRCWTFSERIFACNICEQHPIF